MGALTLELGAVADREPSLRRELIAFAAWWRGRDPSRGLAVYGGVVCQVCGEPLVFSGWVAACFVVFDRGDAVAGWDRDGRRHSHAAEEIADLRTSRYRLCEVCRIKHPRSELTSDVHWTYCGSCERLIHELKPDLEAAYAVRALVRYRWEKSRYR